MSDAPANEVDVGTVLGDTYEITKLIGRGGMGAVYAARHLRLPGKRVAVKVLLGGAASDREAFARFRREAEIASQIGHPNIIEVHDFNTLASGTPYLVLEFLDGEDLATRLARGGRMSLEQTLAVVRQIGSALHAAHRADVVHRDLKPANIFLCPTDVGGEVRDQVKILDFGISKIRGSQTVQTQDAVLLGTPQYMSPEQASGKNQELDQRTDVFALGAIVYEMLAGEPAFSGGNLVAVVFKVVYEPNPSLAKARPDVPPEVVAAVDKAMAKDPAQRFADVASFIEALTGRPMQTLDRSKNVPSPVDVFARTAASGQASPVARAASAAPSTTGARGEVTAAVAPQARKSAWTVPVAIGALLGAAAAGYGIVRVAGSKHAGNPVDKPAIAVAAPVVDAAVAARPPDLAHAAVAIAPPPEVKPEVKPEHHAHAPAKAEALPPEVAADLDAAERALAGGNVAESLHLARRTLNVQKSARAFSIITRAYCKQGDLGNAKAAFHSVGGERGAVLRACKSLGVDLQ